MFLFVHFLRVRCFWLCDIVLYPFEWTISNIRQCNDEILESTSVLLLKDSLIVLCCVEIILSPSIILFSAFRIHFLVISTPLMAILWCFCFFAQNIVIGVSTSLSGTKASIHTCPKACFFMVVKFL